MSLEISISIPFIVKRSVRQIAFIQSVFFFGLKYDNRFNFTVSKREKTFNNLGEEYKMLLGRKKSWQIILLKESKKPNCIKTNRKA